MEVKINKEIRNYTENIYFGLNLRQFIFSLLGVIVGTLLFFLLKNKINTEILSWICILCVVPFGLLGFVKYNGMYMENLFIAFIKSEILMPRYLTFNSQNIYAKDFKGIIDKKLKQGILKPQKKHKEKKNKKPKTKKLKKKMREVEEDAENT